MLRGLLLRDADLTRLIAKSTIEEGRDRLPRLLESVLQRGIEARDIRGDLPVAEVAAVLTDAVVAAALQAITAESEQASRQRVETTIEVVLHGVVVAPSHGGA